MNEAPIKVTAEDIERAESDDRDMPKLRDLLTTPTVFDAE